MISSLFKKKYQTPKQDILIILDKYPIPKLMYNTRVRSYFRLKNLNGYTQPDKKNLIWLGTCHIDGFERERYLKALLKNFENPDINRVLLRTLDWVPQIRKIANDWLIKNHKTIDYNYYIQNIPILTKMLKMDDIGTTKSINLINIYIWKQIKPSYRKILKSLNSKERKYIYYTARNEGTKFVYSLFRNDKDPKIRMKAFDKVFEDLYLADIEYFKNSKNKQIRTFLMKNIFINDPDLHKETILVYLCDKSRSIRSQAQSFAHKFYSLEAYDFYKKYYQSHILSILFLSDFSKQEDLAIFKTGIGSAKKEIVYASIKALLSLEQHEFLKRELPSLLKINRKKINRFLTPLFVNYFNTNEIIYLKNEFLKANFVHGYLNILYKKSIFTCLDEALELLNQALYRESIKEFIKIKILNKSNIYQNFSSELKSKVLDRIDKIDNSILSEEYKRELKFLVK